MADEKPGSTDPGSSADLRTGASAPASLGLALKRARCWNCNAWFTSGEVVTIDGLPSILASYCEACSVDVERGRWALSAPEHDERPPALRFKPLRFLLRNRDRILAALERRTDLIDPQEGTPHG